MMSIVTVFAILAIIISFTFHITPSTYFDGKYNNTLIYGLIVYKLIELSVLYYLLLHRHLLALRNNINIDERLLKLRKHAKLLLFLIPQGNTVFGLIAYKLSGNILFFLIFSAIALLSLFFINPNRLKLTISN